MISRFQSFIYNIEVVLLNQHSNAAALFFFVVFFLYYLLSLFILFKPSMFAKLSILDHNTIVFLE